MPTEFQAEIRAKREIQRHKKIVSTNTGVQVTADMANILQRGLSLASKLDLIINKLLQQGAKVKHHSS